MIEPLVLIYLAIACLLFVLSQTSAGGSGAAYCRASLFLLGIIGIRPGLIGEQNGAIGVLCLIPFAFAFLSSDNFKVRRATRWEIFAIALLFSWDALSSDFQEGFLFVQAAFVSLVGFTAGYSFASNPGNVRKFLNLFVYIILWQTVASLASFFLPTLFPVRVLEIDFGRHWTYTFNSLGGLFVGNTGQFSSSLSALGLGSLGQLPRLTAFWGEPGIFAVLCVFAGALHMNIFRRWSGKIQIPIAIAVLATQSFGAIIIYVIVLLSSLWLEPKDATKSNSAAINKILAVCFAAIVGFLALAQSVSKLDSSNISLTDRAGGQGWVSLVQNILAHPLGNGNSGGINLIQSGVNSGLPTLLIGLSIFVVLPYALRGDRLYSPVFLVPALTIIFVQPPLLPLWFVLLGIYFGSLTPPDKKFESLTSLSS